MLAAIYSPWAWLILVVLILLLFGGKRLVGAGRGLGTGIREFRDSLRGGAPEEEDEEEEPKELPPARPRTAPAERDEI
jgi:sec-independent protein translocase protein TatA